jgi:hypothetical protein
VPGAARPRLPVPELGRVPGAELRHPGPDRLVGHHDPALAQELLDIAQAQGEAVVEPHGVRDDDRGEAVPMVVAGTVRHGRAGAGGGLRCTLISTRLVYLSMPAEILAMISRIRSYVPPSNTVCMSVTMTEAASLDPRSMPYFSMAAIAQFMQ